MQSLFLLEEHRLKTQVKLHTGVYGEIRGEVGSKCRRHARKAAASPGFTSAGCLRGEGAGSPARRASSRSASTPQAQSQRYRAALGPHGDAAAGPTGPSPGAGLRPEGASRHPQQQPQLVSAHHGARQRGRRHPGAPRAQACADKAPPLHLGAGRTGRGPSAGREPLPREAGARFAGC